MTDTPDTSSQDRIAKVMARAGLCSRREAEAWIAEGRVTVNGAKLTTPAVTVGPDDKITVDGRPLPVKERTRLWLYHKPRGLVTTAFDPQGRPTVFERLPEGLPRVMSVGRLDINTEGLLLLTNDGGLSRVLELPTTGWLRKYRVRAHGQVTQAQLDRLKDGVAVDGVLYGGIEAKIDHDQGANIWMTIGLREGKNREIKNVLGSLGMEVSRLIRISFGPFQLGDIPLGEADEVAGRTLRDQLGARLIEAAGADFTSPVNQQPNRAEPGAHPPRQRSRSGGEPTDPKRHGDRPHGRDDAGRGPRGEGRPADARAAPGERGGYRGRQSKDGPERPRSAGYRDRPAGGGGERRGGPGGGEGRPQRPGGRYGAGDTPAGGRDEARGPRGAGPGRPGGGPRGAGGEGRSGSAPRSAGYRDRPGGGAGGGRPGGEGRTGSAPRSAGYRDRPGGDSGERRGGAGAGRPGGGPRGAGGGRPGEGRPRPAPAGASDAPRKTFDRSGLRTPRPESDRGETGGSPAGRGGAPGDRPQGRSGPGGSGGRGERPAGGPGGGYRGPGGSGPGRGPGGPGGNRGPRGAGAGGENRGSGGPGGAGGRDKRPGGQGRPGAGGPGSYRGPGGSGPGRGPGGAGGNRGPRKPGGPSGSGPKRGPRS
ncbi:pseudouridine synthase [Amorphus suaedae]